MPDLRLQRSPSVGLSSPGPGNQRRMRKERPTNPALLTRPRKVQMLRANYFRNETQFLSALEDISNRLVVVPKPARLSALRAELALLNNYLPSEVDIPVICPASIDEETFQTSHHRVVRISPAEATVLNSAERVPFLLMVEVLREDFDFDSEKPENETLLSTILSDESSGNRRRMFDLSEASRIPYHEENGIDGPPDSVFEPSQGDIGTSPIINDDEFVYNAQPRNSEASTIVPHPHLPRLSSGATTLSTMSSVGTPRSSELSRTGSPAPKRSSGRPNSETPDLSALATHMRTAAHMLAQLQTSGSKRPKVEVDAIKAKIIASMQSLEEQSFFFEETAPLPTFDSIMANAATAPLSSLNVPSPEDTGDQPKKLNAEAGAARMENDQMTSGVERKADREDPSAATFGEEWTSKRERIRKASPYGWCKNWDLLSVIVKTGADLRQEAFACQLIHVCDKIWKRANVAVWIKNMRILVTGEVRPNPHR